MERNKWEEEFKEKLNQREITPTPHAWDRLDAMLNAADNTEKPKRNRTWLYIAASVAALILLALALVTKGSQQQQENSVATQEAPQTQSKVEQSVAEPEPALQPEKQTQIAENETQAAPTAGNSATSPKQMPQRRNYLDRKTAPHSNPVAVVQSQTEVTQAMPANTNEAVVNKPTSAHTDSQIAAIDPQLKKPKTVKVDARSLLSQVDGELEMSFREKALTTINKKYQDVKVALANRNNSKE